MGDSVGNLSDEFNQQEVKRKWDEMHKLEETRMATDEELQKIFGKKTGPQFTQPKEDFQMFAPKQPNLTLDEELELFRVKHNKDDIIDHPNHYTQGIECWDYITSHNMDYLQGNIIKYVTRYKHKNGLEDLKKARAYLDKLICDTE